MRRNITYHERLYLESTITPGALRKIRRQLNRHPMFAKVYLITFAANPCDMLEFFEAKYLENSYFHQRELCILGIAESYGGAVSLLEQMLKDCLAHRGDCLLRNFFSEVAE